MSRVCKIILVCEGWRDSAFARGFLEAAGLNARSLEPKTNPGGSGHDWVKQQFAQEVANLARFTEGRGVLGLLDEDGQGPAVRENEIADLLKERGLGPVSAREGRCLLLPTRNLETWLYWLRAKREGFPSSVDEITDYKKSGPPAGAARIGDVHAVRQEHSSTRLTTPNRLLAALRCCAKHSVNCASFSMLSVVEPVL